jgi:hypothetical protein
MLFLYALNINFLVHEYFKENMNTKLPLENYLGSLLGGAVGDALGAPIEFDSINEIIKEYGNTGITDYVEYPGNIGEFTDDTQMTLFTAEGLLRAYHRAVLKGIGDATIPIAHQSYIRWLHTQGVNFSHLDHLFQETHFKLQCDLYEMMNLNNKIVITSKDLLKYCFDDSQEVSD